MEFCLGWDRGNDFDGRVDNIRKEWMHVRISGTRVVSSSINFFGGFALFLVAMIELGG